MTREDKAKKDCMTFNYIEYSMPFAIGYEKGIESGVKWADSHPNIHKYPEDKPEKYDIYLCWINNIPKILEYRPNLDKFYFDSSEQYIEFDKDLITYWNEIYKPPYNNL